MQKAEIVVKRNGTTRDFDKFSILPCLLQNVIAPALDVPAMARTFVKNALMAMNFEMEFAQVKYCGWPLLHHHNA